MEPNSKSYLNSNRYVSGCWRPTRPLAATAGATVDMSCFRWLILGNRNRLTGSLPDSLCWLLGRPIVITVIGFVWAAALDESDVTILGSPIEFPGQWKVYLFIYFSIFFFFFFFRNSFLVISVSFELKWTFPFRLFRLSKNWWPTRQRTDHNRST